MLIRTLKKIRSVIHLNRDPIGYARSLGVTIGNGCDIPKPDLGMFGSEPYLITIGDRVTISFEATFVNHDGGIRIFRQEHPDLDVVGRIKVGNNVFIGMRSIILGGVTIGDNCVIGAGSVVSRDIPSGVVAAGVPAKPIKSVEEYWRGLQPKAIASKRLSPEEKRRVLERDATLRNDRSSTVARVQSLLDHSELVNQLGV